MNTAFRKSFTRDLKKIKDEDVRARVRQVIEQVEAAAELQAIADLKKLSGAGTFFRIRVGDYRIGLVLEGETIEFVRCLPRRDLYRYFP
jgi:mRNA interferase RelE/StbE